MKKRKPLIYLLLILLLTACGKQEIPTDFGDDYIPGYDDSLNECHGSAFSDPLLYIIPDYEFIYCLNLETGESYPLCSKPNCFHNSEDCNAHRPNAFLCRCEDQIIAVDKSSIAWSYRTDGSGADILGHFVDEETVKTARLGGGFGYGNPIAHRGYIYCGFRFYQADKATLRLCRLPASGGSSEIIWEQEFPRNPEDGAIYHTFLTYSGRGNKIYFTYHNSGEASSLCSYDIETGEVSLIRESQPRFEVIYLANEQWYYMTKDGVYCWNPETGEERCFATFSRDPLVNLTEWKGLRFYERGFLLPDEDEPDTFIFYDWDGNVTHRVRIDDVPSSAQHFLLGHFDNYLFCQYGRVSTGFTIAVLNTDYLDDPSLEWMRFEFPTE